MLHSVIVCFILDGIEHDNGASATNVRCWPRPVCLSLQDANGYSRPTDGRQEEVTSRSLAEDINGASKARRPAKNRFAVAFLSGRARQVKIMDIQCSFEHYPNEGQV